MAGAIMLMFINPVLWLALAIAVYGMYAKKGGIINNISVALGTGLLAVSVLTAILYTREYKTVQFPFIFGIFGLVLGFTLITFGLSVLTGIEDTPSMLERITGVMFLVIGVVSLTGDFLLMNIK
jgi:hypothetical protein